MKSFRLITFVKNEDEGHVKTRLASSMGTQEALKAYQLLLKYTMSLIEPMPYYKEIWYSNYIPKNDRWSQKGFEKNLQIGANLGERMRNAFREVFEKKDSERVVLIGSDCAELTSEIIVEAFDTLSKTDAVIGPAADGGYYLVGMKKYVPGIFEGISWSSSEVMAQTIKRLEENGLTYSLLEELNDVDEPEDWEQAKHKLMNV